ncbi:hypothetical protein Q1M64_27060 [Sinorhizobium meliloti]|nr:hypothetical protein Q1M64_27060 [Sinorhizobium meliloti]
MTEPVTFLRELGQAAPEIPLYIEVPEVHWIFENGAFWDFCYEHCNYFCSRSLRNALERAGFSVIEQGPAFGGQYQWAIGTANNLVTIQPATGADAIAAAMNYKATENRMIERARSIVATSDNTAVWGMATKGVMLSCLVGNDLISAGIDINPQKSKKSLLRYPAFEFAPPAWLKGHPVKTILVMNGNYAAEIRQMMHTIGIAADIVVM